MREDFQIIRRHLGRLKNSETPVRDLFQGGLKALSFLYRAPDGYLFRRFSVANSPTRSSADTTYFYKLNKRIRNAFDLPFSLNFSKIEIELTTACNLKCNNCDRSCGQAPSTEHMSLDQLRKFIDESVKHGKKWRKIIIQGGEPLIHPNIHEALQLFVDYKNQHSPGTFLRITTNGYGTRVKKVLESLPREINVMNTGKIPLDDNGHVQITGRPETEFDTYHIATVDSIDASKNAAIDYSKGCHILETGGLGLTRYGYYPCGAGASVDRVFGFNVGAKSLEEMRSPAFRASLQKLCRHCGHFKAKGRYDLKDAAPLTSPDQATSESWRVAFTQYKENQAKLSDY